MSNIDDALEEHSKQNEPITDPKFDTEQTLGTHPNIIPDAKYSEAPNRPGITTRRDRIFRGRKQIDI